VHHLAAVIGEEAHVLFVHHDAVKGDKPFIEQADVLKKGRRPAAQLVPQLLDLARVFQQVRR